MPQLIKILDTDTGVEKYAPYVLGTNTTGAVTSVNSKTGAVILSTADIFGLPVSLASKQDKLTAGSNISITNGVISATGTGTNTGGVDSPVITLARNVYYKEFRTEDYGKIYSDGTSQGAFYGHGYEAGIGINNNERPDIVYQVAAYNTTPNGNVVNPKDGAWSMRVETNYDIPGYPDSFEPHIWNYTDYSGWTRRAFSGYFSKVPDAAGITHGFWSMDCDYLMLQKQTVKGQNPVPYAAISDGSVGVTPSVMGRLAGFTASQRNADNSLSAQFGLWDVGGVGFLKVPQLIDGKGYGHTTLILPSFANDTVAKSTNEKLVAGEIYWKSITVNGETFDVITRVK